MNWEGGHGEKEDEEASQAESMYTFHKEVPTLCTYYIHAGWIYVAESRKSSPPYIAETWHQKNVFWSLREVLDEGSAQTLFDYLSIWRILWQAKSCFLQEATGRIGLDHSKRRCEA